MDYRKEAASDLRDYPRRKAALKSLREDLAELEAAITSIRSPRIDATPVQGGSSTREERLVNAIDRRDRKREAMRIALRQVKSIERGLACLTTQQRDVLTVFYIDRPADHIGVLCERYNVERSQVYRMKDDALRAFTLARYGTVDP